jgi:hypothetical protein
MRESYKIIVASLLSIITYTLVTFVGTIIMLLLKIEPFHFQPTFLGQDIVTIHIEGNVLNAGVTLTGILIFGVLGGVIQFAINKLK